MYQVAALAEGFAWNGNTYPSFSKLPSRLPGPAGMD